MNVKKLVTLALLLGAALIIFIVEAQLPPLTPIPGIKMGLANIITLVVMVLYDRKSAFTVLILRILLSSIFTGQAAGFIYSAAGGILSFCVMAVLYKFIKLNSLWAISVIGAAAHNTGQILVAVSITQTSEIFYYLPLLIISAIITGAFTGITAQLVLKRLLK